MAEEKTTDALGGGKSPGDVGHRNPPTGPADRKAPGDLELPEGPAHSEEEFEIWRGRTHWRHYSGRLLLWLLANGAIAVLIVFPAKRVQWLGGTAAVGIILGLFLVSGGFVVGRIAALILSRRYRLTSQRLFVHRGILSQTVDQMELIRVDDVRIHKTVLDRIFGLGSVEVLSTDTSSKDVVIDGIANPEHLAEAVRSNMRRLRSKSLYVERL